MVSMIVQRTCQRECTVKLASICILFSVGEVSVFKGLNYNYVHPQEKHDWPRVYNKSKGCVQPNVEL